MLGINKSVTMIKCLLVLFILTALSASKLNEKFIKKLDTSSAKTESALKAILKEWNVKDYPNFLKSCFMHKTSWEIMKYKLMQRVLSASSSKSRKTFVASFLGSSVTAGHDSLFNYSTPMVVGDLMRSSFVDVDIDFVSRNVALGNNPCVPYDICVKYFAGMDADIVHWEQSYNCDGSSILEQFIRQAMTIPARPIVVFSESPTGSWKEDKCVDVKPHVVNEYETQLLNADPMTLVSEMNKDELQRSFGFVGSIDKHYHGAGIQTFHHLRHNVYACQGPYIKEWMRGAASWHPSIIAHRLRASHHAYFWLLIWHEALREVSGLVAHRSVDIVLKDVTRHLDTLYPPMPTNAIHKTGLAVDDMKCYTDYEPLSVQGVSLKDRALEGLVANSSLPGWHFTIYEDLVDKKLVERSIRMGYLDFKKLVYGNVDAGPLSLDLSITRDGPVFLCETPGIWGKLPRGFVHFWESKVEIYLTLNVVDKKTFTFKPDAAKRLEVFHNNEMSICTQLRFDGKENGLPHGTHALTIVPTVTEKIIVAWLLTP